MINEKIFHEPHEISIENLRRAVSSFKTDEKILYVFFFTETGEIGVEPFIKDEKNKCFAPIHEDFLMSGERFGFTIISHDLVEDTITQELINDDELVPDEIVQMLIHFRDKKDAEFIEFLSEKWSDNDIFKCL